jgi:protein-S-isoprenylcysteine O-methyltransferase Ste14
MIPTQAHFPFGLLIALVFAWQGLRAIWTFTVPPDSGNSVYLSFLMPAVWVLIVVGGASAPLRWWLLAPGTIGLTGAVLLFEWAKQATRGGHFSYAFSKELPTHLCEDGPFAYIRNPFYASYILSMGSATVMLPGLLRLFVFVLMMRIFMGAAQQEETKFELSPLAGQFYRYRERTGRFFPRLPLLFSKT